jgi:hypothetical protein
MDGRDDETLHAILASIDQHLGLIARSLDALAKVARQEHPEVFSSPKRSPATDR